MNTQGPLVGRFIRRKSCGSVAKITAEKTDRVLVKDTLWRGWMTKARLARDWQLVGKGEA